MADQTDEPIAQSDRMLRDAVAALNVADASLLDANLEPYQLPDWSDMDQPTSVALSSKALATHSADSPSNFDSNSDVQEELRIELGRTRIAWPDLFELNSNSLLALDTDQRALVDLYAGDVHLAKGEVLCLEGRICFRVVELIDGRSE